MGLQNASVRKLGVADMTTTVLTLTLTGVAADPGVIGSGRPHVRRRLSSVALMSVGGTVGAVLWRHGVRWAVTGAALVVGSAAAVARTAPAKL
jgi:uncharacterized membrane protein YoaK (UPF0700 family)